MGKAKFYRIVTCSLLMVHATASSDGYYAKSGDGFEPSRNIFNKQYINGDNINQRSINTYDIINRDRDYSFNSRINQQNIPSNSPLVGHSMDSGPPGYKDTNYETVNSNVNFMKEHLPYNFGKYFVHNNTRESEFGKYGYTDLSQLSNDHYRGSSSYSDFVSGKYTTEIPVPFASMGYDQRSDISTIDDAYINSDHQQLYGKQKGNHFNFNGNYNYGSDDSQHIYSSDVFHIQTHDIKDQIKGLNKQQSADLNDLQSSMSNGPFYNVQGKGINFQSLERPNNYKGNKHISIYPSKSNLHYAIKGYKNNYVPQSSAKGSGKAIIIKIGGQSMRPRYVYLRGLHYPNIKLDVNEGYKKKRSNFLNRQRRPVPANLLNVNYNNEHVNENYDDIQASEMYNRNNDYTDTIGLNTFSTHT